MIKQVVISVFAEKQLRRLPVRIVRKLKYWVHAVETLGLEEVRKSPGYHDEPLKGKRSGQRSIRLSLQHRAIYEVRHEAVEFVSVEEVTKHEY